MIWSPKALLGRYYRRWQQHQFDKVLHSKLTMCLDPWEFSQSQLRHGNDLEPMTSAALQSILEPGDFYVDVGSHVGYLALLARRSVGARGRVVAIEPQPYLANKLLTNFELNGYENLTLFVAACAEKDSYVYLHDQLPADRSRLSLNGPSISGESSLTFRVPTLRLDTILDELGTRTRVKLVKIDVEGYEPKVIDGATKWLDRIDSLIIEVWNPAMPEYQAMFSKLRSAGFRLLDVRGRTWEGSTALPEINLLATRTL